MTNEAIPYRRTYSRILVVLSVLAVPLYLWTSAETSGWMDVVRAGAFTSGISMAALWCPALVYAGLRTGNALDVIFGIAGMLTLFYWVPSVILK